MALRPLFSGRSDVGHVRSRNEDSYLVDPDRGLALVADGMGGHPGGDVASQVASDAAAETLRAWVDERRDGPPTTNLDESLGHAMARCVVDGHQAVRREGARQSELRGMGTTLTAFLLDAPSGRWAVGHAGDSRAYLLRDGALEQVTRDDTVVQAEVDAGRLTPEEARSHPASHVLRQCLGLEQAPEPRRYTGEARDGDRFLLCSDGLTDMLEDDGIRAALAESDDADEAADRLVREALDRGGVDNVTVVVAVLAEL